MGGEWAVTAAPAQMEAGVAESLRQMIDEQFDSYCPEDQRLLGRQAWKEPSFRRRRWRQACKLKWRGWSQAARR
jgi:hypothetical protein